MALRVWNDQTVNLSSPTPPSFFIFHKCTFEHAAHRCFRSPFLCLSASYLWLLGGQLKKKCSAPFSKVFGRIFLGKSEECAVSTSARPQVTPCALHTLQGLKMPGSPVCLLWKTACTFSVSVSHIFIHTHSHAHIHKLLSENAWCHNYNDKALSVTSCKSFDW